MQWNRSEFQLHFPRTSKSLTDCTNNKEMKKKCEDASKISLTLCKTSNIISGWHYRLSRFLPIIFFAFIFINGFSNLFKYVLLFILPDWKINECFHFGFISFPFYDKFHFAAMDDLRYSLPLKYWRRNKNRTKKQV